MKLICANDKQLTLNCCYNKIYTYYVNPQFQIFERIVEDNVRNNYINNIINTVII